ncbi:hypothetical protein V5738_12595 [Salinisphaera sp. SPP-AMP-43]|uniref:hypothetical protein n=1 Tax=Salinisphaera sp. SPP-AMP-43 TaxID=3121288 RepID=UPI003C6E3ED9
MIANPQHLAFTVGMAALVVWRLSVRMRRLMTRQRLCVQRQWITAIVFALLPLVLLPGIEAAHAALWPLLAGLVSGIALGLIGLRLTAFESDHEGHHYRPNAYLGGAIAVLFVLRLGYRLYEARDFQLGTATSGQAAHLDPLTLGILGLLSGFFVTQAAGILHWYYRRAERD